MAFENQSRGRPQPCSSIGTWQADTVASSHTTDNFENFKSPLRHARRKIKIGGGVLFCRKMGEKLIVTENYFIILKDRLLVPDLGANIMFVGKTCAHANLKGSFDAKTIYLYKDNEIVFTAYYLNSMYITNSVFLTKQTVIALISQQIAL